MLIVLSVLSIAIGNVVAMAQTNLKRMLAYSTISHVGYMLLGILAGTAQGYQAAMFYMISYVIVAAGAFGMILLLARQGFEADKLVGLQGAERAQSVVRRHDGDPHVQPRRAAAVHRILGQARA